MLRTIRSRGSLACHVVGVWLLAAPGQLLQHARLDHNRELLFTCLDSNRALLFTGIGADAHDGAGYRGRRPQQLQLGLRTYHIGRVAALGSVPRTPERWFPGTPCGPAPCCIT